MTQFTAICEIVKCMHFNGVFLISLQCHVLLFDSVWQIWKMYISMMPSDTFGRPNICSRILVITPDTVEPNLCFVVWLVSKIANLQAHECSSRIRCIELWMRLNSPIVLVRLGRRMHRKTCRSVGFPSLKPKGKIGQGCHNKDAKLVKNNASTEWSVQ